MLVEQLAREQAADAPPFVGVLQRHGFFRRDPHEVRRIDEPFLAHQVLDAAQHIAEIPAGVGGHGIELVGRLVVVAFHRAAGLDDRNRVVAGTLGGAHRTRDILGAEALVHARI